MQWTEEVGDAQEGIGLLAARYHVSLESLLAINRLTVTSLITPGMTLALPAGAAGSAAVDGAIGVVLDYALAQVGKPYEIFSAGPTRSIAPV